MLCKADAIGVFQVESRAQMSMLPRLRPRKFYDLVIEVAIVRPGPIQGDMVHPYLKRREQISRTKIKFSTIPRPAAARSGRIEGRSGQDPGRAAVPGTGDEAGHGGGQFTAEQANGLRRAMATFRNVGTIDNFENNFIDGMVRRGYEKDFAEACFKQIKGFGSYGFPESHAASFALLVYVSAWIKKHHPAAFAAALLNSQPMGFYAPAEIVRDAREHQVHGAASRCRCQRLGQHPGTQRRKANCACGWDFARSTALPKDDADAIMDKRGDGYRDFADFARRTALSAPRPGDPGGSRCLSRFRAGPPRRLVGGAAAAGRQAAAAVRAARRAGTGRRKHRAPARSCRSANMCWPITTPSACR